MLPSPRWLALAEGLWLALVAEVAPSAPRGAVLRVLDALQWRLRGEASEGEFHAILSEWAAGPSPRDAREGRVGAAVGSTEFATELGKRDIGDEDLAFMFGAVVNELNRGLVLTQGASISGLPSRLALCEKVFFGLDTQGCGYATVDDVLTLAVARRLAEKEDEDATSASPFGLADIAEECAQIIFQLGGDDVVDGILTLGSFKRRCVEAGRSSPKRRRAFHRTGLELHEMGLQKILVLLNSRPELAGCGRVLWETAVANTTASDSSHGGAQLVSFLLIHGPRVRHRHHALGVPWATGAEAARLFSAFPARGVSDSQDAFLSETIGRTVREHLRLLVDFLSKRLPDSFEAPATSLAPSVASTSSFRSIADARGPARYSVSIEDDSVIEEEEEEEEHEEPAILSPPSPRREVNRQDGALIIAAFKLFEVEKRDTYGFSGQQVSQLWREMPTDERAVYLAMARAGRFRDKGGTSASGSSQNGLGHARAHDDEPALCRVSGQDAALLRSRLDESMSSFALHFNDAETAWAPLTVDGAVEHILAKKLTNDSQNRPGGAFPLAEPRQEAKLRRGLGASRTAVTLREASLRVQIGRNGAVRTAEAKILIFDEQSQTRLELSSVDGSLQLGRMFLQGASISSTLLAPEREGASASASVRIQATSSGDEWSLFGSKEELDGWTSDLCFAIAASTPMSDRRKQQDDSVRQTSPQSTARSATSGASIAVTPLPSPAPQSQTRSESRVEDSISLESEYCERDEEDARLDDIEVAARNLRNLALRSRGARSSVRKTPAPELSSWEETLASRGLRRANDFDLDVADEDDFEDCSEL